MNQLDPTVLEAALRALGETLAFRGVATELVVIGGSGLLLLGVVQRATRDVDVVARVNEAHLVTAEPLPLALREAVRNVARVIDLAPDWLNAAPTSLLDFGLPEGFLSRCTVRRYETLVIHVAARLDQIHFKLYAAADHGPRSKHVSDLRTLAPTRAERLAAARWCQTHDPSAGFRESLCRALNFLGVEVRDEELD